MVGSNQVPQWLVALLHEKFYIPCLVHEFEKKCEKNTFCLDCCMSLCPHCLLLHKNHSLLQIRRYVYQDVIRLSDAEKVIDCSFLQPYTTNGAKVVFMNFRPTTRQFRESGNTCVVCDRTLQDLYLFCSLSCKVHHMMGNNDAHITNDYMTHDSNFELPIPQSGSLSGSTSGDFNFTKSPLVCSTTTKCTKKTGSPMSVSQLKCRSKRAIVAEVSEVFNRRKGVPRRSPLY